MDFILDDPKSDKEFRQILNQISLAKSGETVAQMKELGLNYKMNWGASILSLRDIASKQEKNHLLALKLWNKQWRETMILATLLDEPKGVTEEQMDFWTKTFDNTEIAEQASANLWVKSKFAFVKSLEWCRGKKHIIRFTGIHLMGRLAISSKSAIDEMFEPYFGEIITLSKDAQLHTALYRTVIALGSRSTGLHAQCIELARLLSENTNENAAKLGADLFNELTSDYFQDAIKTKSA